MEVLNFSSHLTSKKHEIGVLLLHGLTGSPCEMKPQVKHLTKLGIKAVCPILPGHGGTHKELLATRWQDWFDGACNEYIKLQSECSKVYIAGLSMGSLLTIMLAQKFPQIAGIILMSPTFKYDGTNVPFLHRLMPLADLAPKLGHYFYWTESAPYGLKDERLQRIITKSIENAKKNHSSEFGLFRTYVFSLRQLNHLAKKVKKILPVISTPSLILHSLEDTLTTVNNANFLFNNLGSRNKELKLLTGCDHVLTLDLRKKDVNLMISDFILGGSRSESIKSSLSESNYSCSIA